jgi:hypothetical protein
MILGAAINCGRKRSGRRRSAERRQRHEGLVIAHHLAEIGLESAQNAVITSGGTPYCFSMRAKVSPYLM